MTAFARRVLILLCISLVFMAPWPAWGEVRLIVPEKAYIGQVFTARVLATEEIKKVRFTWRGRKFLAPVSATDQGYGVLVLLGTDVKYVQPGRLGLTAEVFLASDRVTLERKIDFYAKDFPVERLTVAADMVNPPPEMQKRIQEEALAVGRALAVVSPEQLWTPPFLRPVPGDVSSVYGLKRFFNDQPRSPHRGLDFNAHEGEPVRAGNAGQVVLTGGHYFAGNSVYIDHGLGVVSVYLHLSRIEVQEGLRVDKGQEIGLVGGTGRVTAPHLHFGLYVFRQAVDPTPLFSETFFSP
ncbi:MAG: M23 family metallopeptidase [Thermodesulfobacteriota bacterium]